jgi:hypothetical protein
MPNVKELGVNVKLTGADQAKQGLEAVAVGAKQARQANDALAKSNEQLGLTYRQMYSIAQSEMAVRNRQRQLILDHAAAIDIDRQMTEANAAAARRMALAHAEAIAMNESLGRSATTGAHGLGNLRQELTTVTRNVLGLNPAVAQVSSVLGSMALGSGPMIAILGGLAAAAFAFEKLTEASRKAKEEQQKLLDVATQLANQQKFTLAASVEAHKVKLAELTAQYEKLQDQMGRNRVGGVIAGGGGFGDELKKLAVDIQHETEIIFAGSNKVFDEHQEALKKAADEAKSLADATARTTA